MGIDPGSRVTGYGVVETGPQGARYIASGCIRVVEQVFPLRLKRIFDGVSELMALYVADEIAVEQVFMHKNADSALKLGQARGAAICAAMQHGAPVYEYAARQVKLALVGKGSADKQQVQHMVKILLSIQGDMPLDASDALAVALCHCRMQETAMRLRQA